MGKRASKDTKGLKCLVLLLEGIEFWENYLSIIFVRKISCFPKPWFLKMSYFTSRSLENSNWGEGCFL